MGVREALTTGPSHCKCHHTAHQGKLVWAPQQAAPILLAFSSITHWSMVQAVLYFHGNHVPGLWVVFSSLAPSSDQSLCLLHLDPPHPASLRHHCSLPNSWHCGAVWFSWKSVWDWLPRFALFGGYTHNKFILLSTQLLSKLQLGLLVNLFAYLAL